MLFGKAKHFFVFPYGGLISAAKCGWLIISLPQDFYKPRTTEQQRNRWVCSQKVLLIRQTLLIPPKIQDTLALSGYTDQQGSHSPSADWAWHSWLSEDFYDLLPELEGNYHWERQTDHMLFKDLFYRLSHL